MKTILIFILLFFSLLCAAQFVEKNQHVLDSPSIASAIDPDKKIGAENTIFIYNDDVMSNVTFYQEYYEEGELKDRQVIQLAKDERYDEMEEYFSFHNAPLRFSKQLSAPQPIIKADTVAYKPEKDELFFYSEKDYLLGATFDPNASLHSIYFKNEGRIIGKKTTDDFVKFIYDQKGNMIETLGYQGTEAIGENDTTEYLFYVDPSIYIRTAYDHKNRIKTQWHSIDESVFFGGDFENSPYDYNRTLSLTEYGYNNKNQIKSVKTTSFQLKSDWREHKNAFIESANTGTSHPNIERLKPLLYGKTETSSDYTYGENGRVIHRVEHTVVWKAKGNSLAKTLAYMSADNSCKYDTNKVIEEDYYQYVDESVGTDTDQKFIKIISYLDQKGKLVKKEIYKKNKKEARYVIETKEILEFDYK